MGRPELLKVYTVAGAQLEQKEQTKLVGNLVNHLTRDGMEVVAGITKETSPDTAFKAMEQFDPSIVVLLDGFNKNLMDAIGVFGLKFLNSEKGSLKNLYVVRTGESPRYGGYLRELEWKLKKNNFIDLREVPRQKWVSTIVQAIGERVKQTV